MSSSTEQLSLKEWARILVSGKPHQVIGETYLRRWYLIPRNPYLNLYLHHFQSSDDDRALHNHPWWFVSWIIKGSYIEHTPGGTAKRRRWSVAFRPAEWRHRIQLSRGLQEVGVDDQTSTGGPLVRYWKNVEIPVWTVILTGPRKHSWGFSCPQGFKHWQDFESDGGCE